ncbi:MAG: hypothetical protein RL154_711, partial [Pseudomonadota bacterium]
TLYEIDSNRQLRVRDTSSEKLEFDRITQPDMPMYEEPNVRQQPQSQQYQQPQQSQYETKQQPQYAQQKPQRPKSLDPEAARNMLNHIDMPPGKPKTGVFGQMWQWATKLF